MQILPYESAHISGIADLIVPIQQAEFGIPITYAEQPDLQDIPNFYQTGGGGFWIAEVDGKVVGTIGLKDIGAGAGALRKMFVAAAYRGAEHGTAKKLLTELFTHAREHRVANIYLGTTDKFHAAHRFYEKNGFLVIDPAQLPATFPRMAVDTRFYCIKL